MKYITIASLLLVVCSFVTTSCLAESTSAYRIQQYIAPLECVIDDLNDGSNMTTVLSPEDCNEYLKDPDASDSIIDTTMQTNPLLDALTIKTSSLTITPSQVDETGSSVINPGAPTDRPDHASIEVTQGHDSKLSVVDNPIELVVITLSFVSLLILNWRHIALLRKYWYNHR